MIKIAHLLDDFGMGGVTRALTLFDEPDFTGVAKSQVISVNARELVAPALNVDLIIDHMALSWRRLVFLASLRARNPRARIVHIEHSYTRAFEANQVVARKRFRLMLRQSSKLFDKIVCVSKSQCWWLANEVGVGEQKLKVIHPWSGRDELLQIPAARARPWDPLRLLAYGRYAEVKNFGNLITAMRSFSERDVELNIFGDGPLRSELASQAAGLPNVKVLGPRPDPGNFLAHCDAVIVPSRYEAFGLVATEARLAGRAIIVADVDGLPEQVGTAGIVAPMDQAYDIAQAIRTAKEADLTTMGAAGRQEVANQRASIIAGWSDLIASVETRSPALNQTSNADMNRAMA